MPPSDYVAAYQAHLSQLIEDHGHERAMELVVGGQYLEQSVLESSALIALGLQPEHTLVDVGCGSGRLAFGLRDFLTGKFIGTDILEEPLAYARDKCGRPDWEFIRHCELNIPVGDATADFVTLFSVATHLRDEDVFKFLRDAKRALKPTGRLVFSFLDYECDAHWPLFLKTVEDPNPDRVLNKFITKPIVQRWARALGYTIEAIHEGTERWVPIREKVQREDGQPLAEIEEFGQSVAVLSKFPETEYLERHADVRAAVDAGLFASGAHHYEVCGFRERRTV